MRNTGRLISTRRRAFIVLGVLGTLSSSALAYYTRNNMSRCSSHAAPFSPSGLQNQYASSVEVYCPVSDDDEFRKESIALLNVHGYDGSSSDNVWAQTCISYYADRGGDCSPGRYSSGVGQYKLSLSRSIFSTANRYNFGYIWILLPASTGNNSTVRGFYTSS